MAGDGPVNVDVPPNGMVLSYLTRPDRRNRVPLPMVVRPEEVEHAYTKLGAHPEVVQRIWDELGKPLPKDCRRVVYSTPVLLHPDTGTIFALALGTGYGLRLPPPLIEVAISRGARTCVRYTYGGDMNTRRDLGPDWVLGVWLADEPRWCAQAFAHFGRPGDVEPESRP